MKTLGTNFISALALIFAVACSGDNAEISEPIEVMPDVNQVVITKEQFAKAEIQLGNISEMPLPVLLEANGYIEVSPGNRAAVSVHYGGIVKQLKLVPGEVVSRGQVLFTLENPTFVEMQQNYVQSKEQLDYLRADYERQKSLFAQNIASEKGYLKAESDYKSTLAAYHGLRKKLEMIGISVQRVEAGDFTSFISVRAPLDGSATEINIVSGAFLAESEVAIEIINNAALHLELEVFEKDAAKLRSGQKIIFRLPGKSDRKYEASLHTVAGKISAEQRSVIVHGDLKRQDDVDVLLPGMYVEAQIEIEKIPGQVLPESAVVAVEDKHYILTQVGSNEQNYTFKRLPIKIGHRANGLVAVITKDSPGNKLIVTKGAFNLINGE